MTNNMVIPFWVVPLAGGVALIVLLAITVVFWRRRLALRKLEAAIDSVAYEVLRNVLVSNGMDGHIFVQYLLLTERGMLVLDVIERPGSIFGGDQMVEWTAIRKNKGRYTFRNPQHVLYDRMAAVKLLAGDTPVDGRVVFTLRSEFPKGKSTYVLRIDDLAKEFAVADRTRANVVAAFADVWAKVKANVQPTEPIK